MQFASTQTRVPDLNNLLPWTLGNAYIPDPATYCGNLGGFTPALGMAGVIDYNNVFIPGLEFRNTTSDSKGVKIDASINTECDFLSPNVYDSAYDYTGINPKHNGWGSAFTISANGIDPFA